MVAGFGWVDFRRVALCTRAEVSATVAILAAAEGGGGAPDTVDRFRFAMIAPIAMLLPTSGNVAHGYVDSKSVECQ